MVERIKTETTYCLICRHEKVLHEDQQCLKCYYTVVGNREYEPKHDFA